MINVEQLTPGDSLWLAILAREPGLSVKEPDVVRAELREAGFPDRVIEEFLRQQREQRKVATG